LALNKTRFADGKNTTCTYRKTCALLVKWV
jgi:hypothetical protein